MSTAKQTVPSHMRSVPGSVNIPVAKFPPASNISTTDADAVATKFTENFNNALREQDFQAISKLFYREGFWRDHLALSWSFRTVGGPIGVINFLKECSTSGNGFRLKKITIDTSSTTRAPQVAPVDGTGQVSGVQLFFNLETTIGSGEGFVRLVEDQGDWKIFTLYTSLRELSGYEENTYHRRSRGVVHGGTPGRKNWAEKRALASDLTDGHEPVVLIVGM